MKAFGIAILVVIMIFVFCAIVAYIGTNSANELSYQVHIEKPDGNYIGSTMCNVSEKELGKLRSEVEARGDSVVIDWISSQ